MASVPGATGSFLGSVPAITSGPEGVVPNPAAVVADEQTGGGGEDITLSRYKLGNPGYQRIPRFRGFGAGGLVFVLTGF